MPEVDKQDDASPLPSVPNLVLIAVVEDDDFALFPGTYFLPAPDFTTIGDDQPEVFCRRLSPSS